MYKHHCRFQKIDIDENKPTMIYKKLKKNCASPRVRARVLGYRVQRLNRCASIGCVHTVIYFFLLTLRPLNKL